MDSILYVLVPGVAGGLVVAYLIAKLQRPARGPISDPFPGMRSTDVINMANIRVAGVGGLGLVAMALAVAMWVPRIRQSLLLALALGAVMAVVLIVKRRRSGPMPSSGQSAGANTVLSIDDLSVHESRRNTTPPSIEHQQALAR